jgi:hypothetical protein
MTRTKTTKGHGEWAEYRFKIDAYSPETIPMERLAQYMAEFAKLLGESDSVHFRNLTKGSTVLNVKVEREAVPKVRDRVANVCSGAGPGDAQRAYKALNKLLRDDNAVGILRDSSTAGVVIKFPGREVEEEQFHSINQHGSVDGILTGIKGSDETVHLTIVSGEEQITGCETNRSLAKRLAAKLYEPIRLFGRGRWQRDAEGNWSLKSFKVESFDALEDRSLSDALEVMRGIPTEWDDDSLTEIASMRAGLGSKRNGGH